MYMYMTITKLFTKQYFARVLLQPGYSFLEIQKPNRPQHTSLWYFSMIKIDSWKYRRGLWMK
jgi:hypothetical protein